MADAQRGLPPLTRPGAQATAIATSRAAILRMVEAGQDLLVELDRAPIEGEAA